MSDTQGVRQRPIGTAQVFCDESGGSDPASAAFLVAAVAITAADATRLVKSFRKATAFTGEIKGHKFGFAQRATFLDLLAKQRDAVSVVVACQRRNAVGGWAMGALPEAELYGLLLAEACASLPGLDLARHIAVTPDQSRYKRTQAEPARDGLVQAIATRHPAAKVAVAFGDSAELAGLQVADVVVNAAFQFVTDAPAGQASGQLLAPLIASGALTITDAQLNGHRPAWLTGS